MSICRFGFHFYIWFDSFHFWIEYISKSSSIVTEKAIDFQGSKMDHLYVGESLLSFFFSIHWSYKTLFYFCLMDRDLSIVKQFFSFRWKE